MDGKHTLQASVRTYDTLQNRSDIMIVTAGGSDLQVLIASKQGHIFLWCFEFSFALSLKTFHSIEHMHEKLIYCIVYVRPTIAKQSSHQCYSDYTPYLLIMHYVHVPVKVRHNRKPIYRICFIVFISKKYFLTIL